jgi:hypothetical protein
VEREGPIQQAILAWLTRWNNATTVEMACVAYKVEQKALTRDHIRSAKYAVKRLIETGKVAESAYRAKNGQKQYSLITGAKKREPKRQPPKPRGLTIVK